MRFYNKYTAASAVVAIATMTGCASMTETSTTSYVYEIYDVAATLQDRVTVENALISAVKTRLNKVNIQKNLPPHPLPEEAGRFQTQQIGAGTGMGAMMAMAGTSLPQFVSCPGASVVINSNDNDFGSYGENTRYTFCLWQYKKGYHVDAFASFSSKSGISANPNVMAAQLGRALVGDSSKLIPMVMKEIRDKLEATGSRVTVVDRYNPFDSQS